MPVAYSEQKHAQSSQYGCIAHFILPISWSLHKVIFLLHFIVNKYATFLNVLSFDFNIMKHC
jgi:hypothetical protein